MRLRLSRKRREFLLVVLAFTVLTLALTYPAVLHFHTHFMHNGVDGFVFAWNMWWFKTALLEEHTTPFHTMYLHHPNGTDLLLHTLSPFNSLVSIPLQFVFSLVVVYNLLWLFSFVASGVGMYYLARYLVKNRLAAFVAGIIFAFCPYHFGHALGHLNLISTQWMPVYVLFLLKTCDEGGVRNALLAALFLILASLCSWYFLVYMMLMSLLVVVVRAKRLWADKRRLGEVALIAVVFCLVMGPLLGAMIHIKMTRAYFGQHKPENWAAEITSFFVPGKISLYRAVTRSIWKQWPGGGWPSEYSNYIGYTVLTLSVLAVVFVRRARFWAVSGLVFWILALGPYPVFLGKRYGLPMPYLVLNKVLPFLQFTGVPTRFDIMLKFCLAVLVAFALARWFERAHARRSMKWAVPVVLTVLIIVEYLPCRVGMVAFQVPPFFERIARDGDEYAVMEIPARHKAIYGVTIHGKPIVSGTVARREVASAHFLITNPIFAVLSYDEARLPESPDAPALARRVFANYNVRYLITRDGKRKDLIEKRLLLELVDDRGGVRVYDCR